MTEAIRQALLRLEGEAADARDADDDPNWHFAHGIEHAVDVMAEALGVSDAVLPQG